MTNDVQLPKLPKLPDGHYWRVIFHEDQDVAGYQYNYYELQLIGPCEFHTRTRWTGRITSTSIRDDVIWHQQIRDKTIGLAIHDLAKLTPKAIQDTARMYVDQTRQKREHDEAVKRNARLVRDYK